jgi:gephyrin
MESKGKGNSTLTVALLIVSDTASQDPSTDKAIPTLQSVFEDGLGKWNIIATQIVPDDIEEIQKHVKSWADEKEVNCILTSGGTGFAVKDKTPEVVQQHTPRLSLAHIV